jgi:hypothetical protein
VLFDLHLQPVKAAIAAGAEWEVDTGRATLASTSTVRGWESLPVRLG